MKQEEHSLGTWCKEKSNIICCWVGIAAQRSHEVKTWKEWLPCAHLITAEKEWWVSKGEPVRNRMKEHMCRKKLIWHKRRPCCPLIQAQFQVAQGLGAVATSLHICAIVSTSLDYLDCVFITCSQGVLARAHLVVAGGTNPRHKTPAAHFGSSRLLLSVSQIPER